ncbi:MAG TPA: hypothetical protein VK066_08610 [Chloroflexota bacterium]|nr:hypothetical protein [Chloroflexota bacterium]
MRRRSGLARWVDRAWARYDQLGEWQRIGFGLAVALLLAASLLYTVGAASLIALARYQPPPTMVAVGTATPTLLPIATDVNPISPLLAERSPTARPTATPTPVGGAAPARLPSATSTRPSAGAPSPTLGVVPRAAATATLAAGGARLATATRTPIRTAVTATRTPTRAVAPTASPTRPLR